MTVKLGFVLAAFLFLSGCVKSDRFYGFGTGTGGAGPSGSSPTDSVGIITSLIPTILGMTPTTGGAGMMVSITGTNFTSGASVSINGMPCSLMNWISATQVDCMVAPGTTSGSITVTTANGSATSTINFTMILSPTIAMFSPIAAVSGTTVTITGTNLSGISAFDINGVACASFANVSSTSATCVVAPGSGSGPIHVTTLGGTATSAGSFSTLASPPTITGVSPNSGAPGATITVTGTNLTGITAFDINGTACSSFAVVSSTSATCVVALGSSSGPIHVTTPGGTATSGSSFTYLPNAPTIASFAPASGTPGTTITITGTNLNGITAFDIGGTACSSFASVSATSATCIVAAGSPSGALHVTTSEGTATSPGSFVTLPFAPTITNVSPNTGAPGTVVTVTGTNLSGITAFDIGGTPCNGFTVLSATSATCNVAPGTSSGPVHITTAGGTVASGSSFIALPSAPTIASVSPSPASQGSVITVTGTNLSGITAFDIGGTPCSSFIEVNASSATCVVALGTLSGPVHLTTAGGTATSGSSLTVLPPAPTIASFTPNSAGPGATVTVTGTNLSGITAFAVNGTACSSFASVSSTSATCAVAFGSGTGPLTITTAGGTVTSAGSFTLLPAPPYISGFSPNMGAPLTEITVNGLELSGISSFKINGTDCKSFTQVSAVEATCEVDYGTTSGPITIVTPGGTATSASSFTALDPAPVITGFTPSSAGVGATIVISGNYFNSVGIININGTPCDSFSVVSSTSANCVVAAGTTSGPIQLTTPGGTAVSASNFTFNGGVVPAPTFGTLSPNSGSAGTTITITGTNLQNSSVTIGGTACGTVVVNGGGTSLTCVVGTGSAGAQSVIITTAGGSVTAGVSFTYNNSSDFAPSSVAGVYGWGWGYNVRPLARADGSITLSGTASSPAIFQPTIACVEGSGAPCAGFGTNGTANLSFPGIVLGYNSSVLQNDGKIIAAGGDYAYRPGVATVDYPGGFPLIVTRFTSAGQPDATFATGGTLKFNILAEGEIMRYGAAKADGTIYVTSIGSAQNPNYITRIGVASITSAGVLNPSFGNGGKVEIDPAILSSQNYYTDVPNRTLAIAGDGGILVSGKKNGYLAVIKLSAAGVVDPSFSIVSPLSEGNMIVLPTGKIILAGTVSGSSLGIARYDAAGVLDSTFGNNGFTTVSMSYTHLTDVVYSASNDKLYLGGSQQQYPDYYPYVFRFNGDGTVDTTYGTNGVFIGSEKGMYCSGIDVGATKVVMGCYSFSHGGTIALQANK